jgi:transposase
MERHTPEFRKDAVSLVSSSGRPIKQVARELGISDTTLGNWIRAERKGSAGLTKSVPG